MHSTKTTNLDLFNQAKQCIPGGVNSPVRSFKSVGGIPFFTKRAKDCYLFDVEDNSYIDYICSWGANIVGHANPYVVDKVTQAILGGFSYGTPTELEVEFAKTITKLIPSIEMFRLVSSGTEAVMSAIRVARGKTQRKYIIKFDGCYHGHADYLLVNAGSGLLTHGSPSSKGVLEEAAHYTLTASYNDINSVQMLFEKYHNQIAAIIIEPYVGNMNLIKPTPEFIQTLSKLCRDNSSLLIFDEVMTGFRVALTGAQGRLNITPDLTIFGKVIGGGMPLAGFGGKKDIMEVLSPLGDVYQAGTLSGNPIAVTCGLATLDLIQQAGFYSKLESNLRLLVSGINKLASKYQIPICADSIGGMFGVYCNNKIPTNFAQMQSSDAKLFNKFFHKLLVRGVYIAPSLYEAGFICSAHTENVINQTLEHVEQVLVELSKEEL
jgi:glutamate-1-semialdehyde 2,1-aminomutase